MERVFFYSIINNLKSDFYYYYYEDLYSVLEYIYYFGKTILEYVDMEYRLDVFTVKWSQIISNLFRG